MIWIIQLLRPLMSQWQISLRPVIHSSVQGRYREEQITKIPTHPIKTMPNLLSAFMLMVIIIITNAIYKQRNKVYLQRTKEKYQQSFPWLLPFHQEINRHLNSSNNNKDHNKVNFRFHTTLHNNTDNNLSNITNIILTIRLIRE